MSTVLKKSRTLVFVVKDEELIVRAIIKAPNAVEASKIFEKHGASWISGTLSLEEAEFGDKGICLL